MIGQTHHAVLFDQGYIRPSELAVYDPPRPVVDAIGQSGGGLRIRDQTDAVEPLAAQQYIHRHRMDVKTIRRQFAHHRIAGQRATHHTGSAMVHTGHHVIGVSDMGQTRVDGAHK